MRKPSQQDLRIHRQRTKSGWQVELVDDHKARSWCSIIDVNLRVGAASIRTGGIGGVGTLPEYRRRGYSRRVMEAAVAAMQQQRYGLSFLHGIQDFYHRFDYVTCMAEHEFSLETASLLAANLSQRRGIRLRPMRKTDLPAMIRLYNRQNASRTGSVVRSSTRFGGFDKGTWWTFPAATRVAVDQRDRIVGYVVVDDVPQHCRAAEMAGSSVAVFAALVHFLGRRAQRQKHAHVQVYAPSDHPFAIYCRRFGQRLSSLYPRNEKPMGRIIDLHNCLHSIVPELARRWGSHNRDLALALHTDVGQVTLRWHGAQLSLEEDTRGGGLQLGQQELTLLLFGYARPSDLLAWQAARIEPRHRELVQRLFPLQEAHMWWPDRF